MKEKIDNKESKVKKIGNTLNKKWLVNGSKTIILVAIIICIYIGINILLKNVILPEIDLTSNKIYSLSEETKTKLGNLDKEIKVTLINYSNYTSVINFAERYVELNNKIKIEKVDDLSVRPDLMQTYSLNATDNLIIVSTGDRSKTLTDADLYTYDYTTGKQIDATEETVTNAILDITTETKPKVYFMTNHVMYSSQYFQTIIESMKKDANEVETLDILSKGEIPQDCNTLVITTLKEDISEQERDLIIKYIQNGGEILMMFGPNLNNISLPNFQKVLDEYGMTIENGAVFEGDSSKMLSGYPTFIIEETQSTSLTEKLKMTMNICLPDAAKIKFNEEKLEELKVTYEQLARTSEKSFLRTNFNLQSTSKTSQDGAEESITVAAIATKTVNDEGKTSKLVVYSNEMFAMDMQVTLNGYSIYTVNLYNNEDMILNSIAYLNERENTITIRKDYDDIKYTVTEAQNTIIMIIIFTIPFVIIVIGIIVWQVRRRKK